MTFRRGQQLPYRKWAAPALKYAKTKAARKKAREEMEVVELPEEIAKEDNSEDDEVRMMMMMMMNPWMAMRSLMMMARL